MKTTNKIEIKETSEYQLLDSYVNLSFEIRLEKENISNLFLIRLGEILSLNKAFNVKYNETDSTIYCVLSGYSISGNFEMTVKNTKTALLRELNSLCLSYNYTLEENLLNSFSMKDVFFAQKEASLILKDFERFYISGISKHINNNNVSECLFIKIGYLFYTEDMFNSGILAKFLIDFVTRNQIKIKPGKSYFSVNSKELSELIDNLEERNKKSLL